ncbi:MAG: hypothetical protein JNL01_13440 [Bdellovibrionales bacterium]|nr:hypothetical protein [Bdellovibrionales bacterium]
MSDSETTSQTIVETALRSQREYWKSIPEKVLAIPGQEFPHEGPRRVILLGVGSSYFAAKLTAYTLIRDRSRIRIPVLVCKSTGFGVEVLPSRGDWVIGFTHRGRTESTLKALDMASQLGCFTIQVSAQDVIQAPGAKFLLETTPVEKAEPHTMAVTGSICAVTTLLSGIKLAEEWEALRSLGDPDLDLMKKRAGKGANILLGEWEGEWIAREGALKLLEMAGLPARAYSSEEFFHGPRFEYSREKDVIWHVSLPKDPRESMIRAAHSIGVYGSSPLAWVPALVEMQWLALATALNLGVNPDRPALADPST